jgi:hypothetical protein
MKSDKIFHICSIDDCWRVLNEPNSGGIKESFIEKYLTTQNEPLQNEPALKKFVSLCIDDPEFIVTAYSSPNFLLTDLRRGRYFPDYLVIDWDFGGSMAENEEIKDIIQDILKLCPVDAVIFSVKFDNDNDGSIKKILKEFLSDELLERIDYKSKMNTLDKMEEEVEDLINKIKNNYKDNKGYNLYKNILQIFNYSTQKVFAEIFRFGFDKYQEYTMEGDDDENTGNFIELINNKISDSVKEAFEESHDSHQNLLDHIIPRIVNEVSSNFDINLTKGSSVAPKNIQAIWNHRLYSPAGENIKTGTILKKKENSYDKLYMVMTRECDLACFFDKKNLARKTNGNVLMIELEKQELPKDLIVNSLTDFKKGAYWLLCIKNDEFFYHYKCEPRKLSICQIQERKHEKGDSNAPFPLSAADMIDYEPICVLNQPFLSNLIMSVFNYNMGYGVPNYTTPLKKFIKQNPNG